MVAFGIVLYSFALSLALALAAPWWLARMVRDARYRTGLSDRFGRLPRTLDAVVTQRTTAAGLVWLHAVSVGEVLAAQRLVAELQAALPGHLVVVSTTTAAGQQVAQQKLGVPTFFFPLDFAFAVRPYLRALRPTLFVTIESELWPRMLVECERAGIPVAVVNARISDRSFPRYLRLRRLWKPLLAKVSLFLAQGPETAQRLYKLGVPAQQVQTPGNLKYDLPPAEQTPIVARVQAARGASRIIVAGSTLAGEEQLLLDAWPSILRGGPDFILILAPRHPQRFPEVWQLIQKHQPEAKLATHWSKEADPTLPGGTILLLDTLGDLANLYATATVAFIGGSLVPKGGHNPLEAARFGVPIVMGQSFENFREVVYGLQRAGGAIRLVTADQLAEALIDAARYGRVQGRAGRAYFEQQSGATLRCLKALLELEAGRKR